MKSFIIKASIVSVLCLGLGYGGTHLVVKNFSNEGEAISQAQSTEMENIKTQHSILENLSKTYLVASVNYDWNSLKSMSTGEYLEELNTKIIPNFDESKKQDFKFNSTSMAFEIKSINQNQALVELDYILNLDDLPYQQSLNLYLVRENGNWKVFKVETKK